MKKIFLLVAFAALSATVANAQFDRSNYQWELNLGYTVGFEDTYGRVNLRTVHGFRFNEYFFAGVGAGFDIYHGVDRIVNNSNKTKAQLTLPLYINAKAYLPVADRVNIFFGIDMGYSIGLSPKKDDTRGTTLSGILFMPEWGVGYQLDNGRTVTFGMGYSVNSAKVYQKSGGTTSVSDDTFNNNGFSLRFGYVF